MSSITRSIRTSSVKISCLLAVSTLCVVTAFAGEATPLEPSPAESLRLRHGVLREQLEQSPLQSGLHLESVERSNTLQGDAYAVVDYPFATVRNAFANPDSLCEALILHLNIKYCRARLNDGRPVVSVAIGKKTEQPISDTYRVDFDHSVTTLDANYMRVNLDAKEGPVGTKDYRISLEMIALDVERAFLHIQFTYTNGIAARLATNFYLASAGRDKVGFTQTANSASAQPRFVGGMRGIAERNTMRYFLAIDAYLSALSIPQPQRFTASSERWFAATERYALQLHELDRDTYIAMKRAEYQRQNL
jgi:hypothetical protein